jgi:hypothetical protein
MYQEKQNIPDINSVFVAWYIYSFVDWDIDLECYVSKSIKSHRAKKEEEISIMFNENATTTPTMKELEFLFIIEQDQIIQPKIYKLLKFWRNKLS